MNFQSILDAVKGKIANYNQSQPSVVGNLLTGQGWNQGIPDFGGVAPQNQMTENPNVISPVPAPDQLTKGLEYKMKLDAMNAANPQAPTGPYPDIQYNPAIANAPAQEVMGAQAPTPTITPTPAPNFQNILGAQKANPNINPNITIPYSRGGQYTLPADLSQIMLNAFNDIGQATNSAKVLNHPADNPYLPGDPSSVNHTTYGENGSFKTNNIDVTNNDGSVDRGLYRINNNSFNGIMADPHWGGLARDKFGIKNWQDMEDPQKNAYMAKLIYERNSGWRGWYAAPKDLRAQGRPNLAALDEMLAKK